MRMKGFFSVFSTALMLVFCSLSYSQPNLSFKYYNLKNDDSASIGSFSGGKLWLMKDLNQLVYFFDDEIRLFSLADGKITNVGLLRVEEEGLKSLIETDKKPALNNKIKNKVSFFWNVPLRNDEIKAFTIDTENNLITADSKGDLFFYNIDDKEFLGRINMPKGDVVYINALNNGSLVIIYRNGDVGFVEKMKLPFFSFFQTLRDTYSFKEKIKIDSASLKFIGEHENTISLLVGHKEIYILSIPTLNIVKKITEEKYIDFADILGNKIFYSIMDEARIEGSYSFHRHLSVMARFYEKKKDVCSSKKGNRFSYVANLSNIRFFDIITGRLMGEIGINVKDVDCIRFAPQEKYTALLINQKKISIYKID